MDNAFEVAINDRGTYVATPQGRGFTLYDVEDNRIVTRIRSGSVGYAPYRLHSPMFMPDGRTLIGFSSKEEKIYVVDPVSKKTLIEIQPHFMQGVDLTKFYRPHITALALSPDGASLYVASNRKHIEKWELGKGLLGLGDLSEKYVETLVLSGGQYASALMVDPKHPWQLYVAMHNEQLNLWDWKQKKIIQTYKADNYMDPKGILLSDSGRFVLVWSQGRVYVWRRNRATQWDMFAGGDIRGALFVPRSDEIIVVGRQIEQWRLRPESYYRTD
jgi:WD40 repeat protein